MGVMWVSVVLMGLLCTSISVDIWYMINKKRMINMIVGEIRRELSKQRKDKKKGAGDD